MISLYSGSAPLKNSDMSEKDLIEIINQELGLLLPGTIAEEELRRQLSIQINYLIVHDFQKLVAVLYRVDVNEEKLKQFLKENSGQDAGFIIADLIIERQLQKIKSRREFRKNDNTISDEEKW
jgi:hypothetical protein